MALKRVTLAAGVASVCAFGGVSIFACGDTDAPVNELIVAVDTTGPIPSTGYQMYLEVQQGNSLTTTEIPFLVGSTADTNNKLLPATLGVTSASGSSSPVLIRLLTTTPSSNSSVTPLAEREVSVVIPQNRVSLLRIPIDALCFDGASIQTDGGVLNNVNPIFPASVCPTGQTCIAGSCQDNGIDAASLVPFSSTSALSGNDAGECFPLQAAFLSSASAGFRTRVATTSTGACSATLPVQVTADVLPFLNVGVPIAQDFCSAYGTQPNEGTCVVPLDFQANAGSPQAGWTVAAGGTTGPLVLTLPPGACTGPLASGSVIISTGIPSKVPTNPVCGPWVVVGTADVGDGGGAIDFGGPVTMADGGVVADAGMPGPFPGPIALADVTSKVQSSTGSFSDFALGANDVFTVATGGLNVVFNSIVDKTLLDGTNGSEFTGKYPLTNPDYNPTSGQLSFADTNGAIYSVAATHEQANATPSMVAQQPDDGDGGAIVGLAAANDGVYDLTKDGHITSCMGTSCSTYMLDTPFEAPFVANVADGGQGVVTVLPADVSTLNVLAIAVGHIQVQYGSMSTVADLAVTAGTAGSPFSDHVFVSGTPLSGAAQQTPGIYSGTVHVQGSLTYLQPVLIPGPIAATSRALFFFDRVGQTNVDTTFNGTLPPAGIYGCILDSMGTDRCGVASGTHLVVDFGASQAGDAGGVPVTPPNDMNVVKMRVVGANLYWLGADGIVRGIALDSRLTDQ